MHITQVTLLSASEIFGKECVNDFTFVENCTNWVWLILWPLLRKKIKDILISFDPELHFY